MCYNKYYFKCCLLQSDLEDKLISANNAPITIRRSVQTSTLWQRCKTTEMKIAYRHASSYGGGISNIWQLKCMAQLQC